MSIPVFINLESNNQLDELRGYIVSKGISIGDEETSLEEKLNQVIKASEMLWKEAGVENELELVMNSIISMVVVMPRDCIGAPTTLLTTLLSTPSPLHDKRNVCKLKLLNNLFAGLEETSPLRYNVYSALVSLAGQSELLHLINIKLGQIKEWVGVWKVDVHAHQQLLNNIHQACVLNKQTDKASKVMVELLHTYTKEDAALAVEDARRCIVACIGDASVLLFEHLRMCEPVKFLEGEPLHQLLLLFVGGSLKEYLQFEKEHYDVIKNHNLSHDDNVKKMRLLTLCSMADNSTEISFEDLQQELLLEAHEIEPFLSEVLKSKVAQLRIDQTKRKVQVHSGLTRVFGLAQWGKLQTQLEAWRRNIGAMANTLHGLAAAAAVAD